MKRPTYLMKRPMNRFRAKLNECLNHSCHVVVVLKQKSNPFFMNVDKKESSFIYAMKLCSEVKCQCIYNFK